MAKESVPRTQILVDKYTKTHIKIKIHICFACMCLKAPIKCKFSFLEEQRQFVNICCLFVKRRNRSLDIDFVVWIVSRNETRPLLQGSVEVSTT